MMFIATFNNNSVISWRSTRSKPLTCHKSLTNGAISGAGTAYPSKAPELDPVFSGIRVTRFLVLCECLFVLLYFFFKPLCCLFFFDLWILITPLVSSNSSYHIILYRVQSIPRHERDSNSQR